MRSRFVCSMRGARGVQSLTSRLEASGVRLNVPSRLSQTATRATLERGIEDGRERAIVSFRGALTNRDLRPPSYSVICDSSIGGSIHAREPRPGRLTRSELLGGIRYQLNSSRCEHSRTKTGVVCILPHLTQWHKSRMRAAKKRMRICSDRSFAMKMLAHGRRAPRQNRDYPAIVNSV